MDKQEKTIVEAAAKFPAYFGLRNYPGENFTIHISRSYVNDNGRVWLNTKVLTPDGMWKQFMEAIIASELYSNMVRLPPNVLKKLHAKIGHTAEITSDDDHVQLYVDWAKNNGKDPDRVITLKTYEATQPGIGRSRADKIADLYLLKDRDWRSRKDF